MSQTVVADVRVRSEVETAPVAPWWHTLLVVGALGMWAIYGAFRSYWHLTSSAPRILLYSGQVMLQWLLVGSTIAGLYHRREFLFRTTGRFGFREAVKDLWTGLGLYCAGMVLMAIVAVLLKPAGLTHNRAAVQALVPDSYPELGMWLLVSATAAAAEEFMFRGYLLQQLRHWFGSTATAVAVSAILFGVMHLYEGTASVVIITMLGAYYAFIAVRVRNIRGVMVAHFLQDALTGIYLFARLHQ